MLKESDSFSFVYVRYTYQDKLSNTCRKVKAALKKFKMFSYDIYKSSKRDKKQRYDDPHIYRLIMYKSEPEAIDGFAQADSLFAWGDSKYPRDLAFYKNDYAWFLIHSASHYAVLYTDDDRNVEDLKRIGADIEYIEDIDDFCAEYDEVSKKKIFPF